MANPAGESESGAIGLDLRRKPILPNRGKSAKIHAVRGSYGESRFSGEFMKVGRA